MKRLLVVAAVAILAAAVAAGIGARGAAAGEVTGNCNHAKSEKAAAKAVHEVQEKKIDDSKK